MKLLTIIAIAMASLFFVGKIDTKYLLVEIGGGSEVIPAVESGHCENLNHPDGSLEMGDSKYHNKCKHATETSCEKDPECKWHGIHKHVDTESGHCEDVDHPEGSEEIGDGKYHNMCKYATEASCEKDTKCKWHGIHKHVATESGHCEDVYHPEVSLEFGDLKYHSICKYATETSCEKDPKCKWHGIHKHVAAESGHCENFNHPAESMEMGDSEYHNMCKHATETSCEKDPECKWHGIHKHVATESGHCEDVKHPEGSIERLHVKYHDVCRYRTETSCEKHSSCKWHGAHIPGRHIIAE